MGLIDPANPDSNPDPDPDLNPSPTPNQAPIFTLPLTWRPSLPVSSRPLHPTPNQAPIFTCVILLFFAIVEGKGLAFAQNQIQTELKGILIKNWLALTTLTLILNRNPKPRPKPQTLTLTLTLNPNPKP